MYVIDIVNKNKIIESYQTNKIDDFQILDTVRKKITQIELYNSAIMTYRSMYPKLNYNKILKMHSDKLKGYMDGHLYKVIKVINNEIDDNIICCYYYIKEEILSFLKLNKICNKKITSIYDKIIFNNKYKTLLLINNYEIALYNNKILKFYNSVNLKTLNQNITIVNSLIFINYNVKRLYVLIEKNLYDDLSSFIKKLQTEVEERVKIIVEKI